MWSRRRRASPANPVRGLRPHHQTRPSIPALDAIFLRSGSQLSRPASTERRQSWSRISRPRPTDRTRHRDAGRRGVDRRDVRGLLTVTGACGSPQPIRVFDPIRLAAAPPGGGAARAVRRAALPLRHAQAVVPEEPDHRRRWCNRWPSTPMRGPPAARPASTTPSRVPTCTRWACWPVEDAGPCESDRTVMTAPAPSSRCRGWSTSSSTASTRRSA